MPNGVPPEPTPPIKAAMLEMVTVLTLLAQLGNGGDGYHVMLTKLNTEAHRLHALIEGGLP